MLWEDNYLAHYGIKGQRWGLRRFQNEDGTLTLEGKKRYLGESLEKLDKLIKKQEKRVQKSPGDTSKQRTLNDMRLISDYKNTKKELRKLTKGDDWDAYKPGDPQNKINYPGVTDKMVEKADQLRQKRDALYEKVSKIGTKVDDLPSPETENKDYLGITGAKKPGLFARIKANAEAMVYPPELQGKSKEEKKAWEEAENKKFDEATKEYNEGRKIVRESKNFEKMTPDEKKDFGDKVLSNIDNYLKNRDLNNVDEDLERNLRELESFVGMQVSTKSGSDTSVGSVTEANRAVREKIAKKSDEANRRMEEVKTEIGYDHGKLPVPYNRKKAESYFSKLKSENQRLSRALQEDKTWSSIKKDIEKLQGDWQGIVLRDIGFRDTPENRRIIWPYIIEMWD